MQQGQETQARLEVAVEGPEVMRPEEIQGSGGLEPSGMRRTALAVVGERRVLTAGVAQNSTVPQEPFTGAEVLAALQTLVSAKAQPVPKESSC